MRSRKAKLKAIVLNVHGCSGPGGSVFHNAEGKFFNALGFRYFVPDSFADPRPAHVCGELSNKRRRDATIIWKLRIAQTHRTINHLKKMYPGLPIFLWGHSEGSHIVQMIRADVAGIISSGNWCGVNGSKIASKSKVRVLYLLGDQDPYVTGKSGKLTSKRARKCKKMVRTKKVQITVLKDAGHDTFVWRNDVAEAITKFLTGKKKRFLAPLSFDHSKLNSKQEIGLKLYSAKQGKKAFAVSYAGQYQSVWDGKFTKDVRGWALYECALQIRKNPFLEKEVPCKVIDVNGKPVE